MSVLEAIAVKRLLPLLSLFLCLPLFGQNALPVDTSFYSCDAFVTICDKILNQPYASLQGMDQGFIVNPVNGTSTTFNSDYVFWGNQAANFAATSPAWLWYGKGHGGPTPGTTITGGNYGVLGTIASNTAWQTFTGTLVSGGTFTGTTVSGNLTINGITSILNSQGQSVPIGQLLIGGGLQGITGSNIPVGATVASVGTTSITLTAGFAPTSSTTLTLTAVGNTTVTGVSTGVTAGLAVNALMFNYPYFSGGTVVAAKISTSFTLSAIPLYTGTYSDINVGPVFTINTGDNASTTATVTAGNAVISVGSWTGTGGNVNDIVIAAGVPSEAQIVATGSGTITVDAAHVPTASGTVSLTASSMISGDYIGGTIAPISTAPASFAANDVLSLFTPYGQTMSLAELENPPGQISVVPGTSTLTLDNTPADMPPADATGYQINQAVQAVIPAGTSFQLNEVIDTSASANLTLNGMYSMSAYISVAAGSGAVTYQGFMQRQTGITAVNNLTTSVSGSPWTKYTVTGPSVSEGPPPNAYINLDNTFLCAGGGSACTIRIYGIEANENADTNISPFTDALANFFINRNSGARFINIIASCASGARLETLISTIPGRRGASCSVQTGMTAPQGSPAGIWDVLQLEKAIGAKQAHLDIPNWWTPPMYGNLMDWLRCSNTTVYGAKCAALGFTDWTAQFSRITLDDGNELWNTVSSNAGVYELPAANILPVTNADCGALKARSSYTSLSNPSVINCNASVQQFGSISPNVSSFTNINAPSISLYSGQYPATGNLTASAIYLADLAQTQGAILSDSSTIPNQAFALGKFSSYEGDATMYCGTGCTAGTLTGIPEGGGEGLLQAILPLALANKYKSNGPYTTSSFEAVGLTTTTNVLVNGWGEQQQLQGSTHQIRPRYWYTAAVNACMKLGYFLTSDLTSTINTFNFAGYNGIGAESNVPYQGYVKCGNAASSPTSVVVVVWNADPVNSYNMTWSGSTSPASSTSVVTSKITSAAITTSNETAQNVVPVAGTATSPTGVNLAPLTLETFSYTPGGSTPANWFVRLDGNHSETLAGIYARSASAQ